MSSINNNHLYFDNKINTQKTAPYSYVKDSNITYNYAPGKSVSG